MGKTIPPHLQRYIVKQDEGNYTATDHSVWRFIMRNLSSHLSQHAHTCYLKGLINTGISTEKIPSIQEIGNQIEKFGWSAISVSGFIPPAAFMELQALGYLPIATDMRTIDHLEYTPAPDIVHEAAGHAPILIDDKFSAYLKEYAAMASKAILCDVDISIYEAIRRLSDIKESPDSSREEVLEAKRNLEKISSNPGNPSEAALLARMNWWTAEYGLIGTLEDPKIYGAGLLSSVSESQSCFEDSVKKIPFSLKCLDYSYDITEPQPQLFVVQQFEDLTDALIQFSNTMAYKLGGVVSLKKCIDAKTVNTVELNSGIQISGKLSHYLDFSGKKNRPNQTDELLSYLQFTGPCQLSVDRREVADQGPRFHAEGFGCPIGKLEGSSQCLSQWSESELSQKKLIVGNNILST